MLLVIYKRGGGGGGDHAIEMGVVREMGAHLKMRDKNPLHAIL